MAMNPEALKAKMQLTIYNGLKAEFSSPVSKGQGYQPISDEHWQKMAKAISGIAADIVLEIVQNATVAPGIATVGGPVSQVSVSPGKVI